MTALTRHLPAPVTDREAANLRAVIESYALAVLERSGGRTKSVSFPAGTVKTRTAEHWDWPDDPLALMEIASDLIRADHDDLVRFTAPAVDKAAVKKHAQVKDGGEVCIDGLVLPGVHVEHRTTVSIALSGEHETADDDEVEP